MIIPIVDITRYDGDWDEYLENICLYEIFKELILEFGADKEKLTGIIHYIVWAYSIDSDKLVIGSEWLANKKRIFKLCKELPETGYWNEDFKTTWHDAVVLLKSKTILFTIKKWLNYQNDDNFQTWCMLKDLISEFRIAANSPILKSTGEIDYEAKRKCAESVIDLMQKKSDVEQTFIQNNPKLKEAYKEITKVQRSQTNSFGVESFSINGK